MTNKKIQQWALKLSRYNCKIEYLVSRDDTCMDLEAESIRVEPGIDDRAYQIQVINSN